jgi:hypothetical protein
MLNEALKAGLPVVSCTTTDLWNLREVLNFISEFPIRRVAKVKPTINPSTVYYSYPEDGVVVTRQMVEYLMEQGSTLIVVNPEARCEYAFDAGEVPVPKALVAHYLANVVDCPDDYMASVAGLTLKQLVEVIKIAQVVEPEPSPRIITKVRARITGAMQGLQQVSSEMGLYLPDYILKTWIEDNLRYFVDAPDSRLVPRGMLLAGPPGVGKTQAAKYIASEFGVSLYRLDLSSSLGRFVGESESNLSRVLSAIDNEAPCVMLVDEVEKLFSGSDDSGVTNRLLSQLLWWLQEHQSKVFTVMTTNNKDALPPELYRAGRIDKILVLDRLMETPAKQLAIQVAEQFVSTLSPSQHLALVESIHLALASDGRISHADVVSVVHSLIKTQEWV